MTTSTPGPLDRIAALAQRLARLVPAALRPRLARLGSRLRPRTRLARLAAARRARIDARPLDHPATLRFRLELLQLATANRLSRRRIVNPRSDVAVTMTTHGRRLADAHLAIESIARGSVRPARMMLWLDDAELFAHPTPALRRLQRRGLEILLSENYKVHTKYFPHLLSGRAGEHDLVTSDDDIVYPRTWLAGLLRARAQTPHAVICYRARRIELGDQGLAPYAEWREAASVTPSYAHFGTSVSGQLFPRALLLEVAEHGDAFRAITPDNDDIWLHVRAVAAGFRIRQVTDVAQLFRFVPGTQQHGLYLVNYWDGGNDRQVAASYGPTEIERIRTDDASV